MKDDNKTKKVMISKFNWWLAWNFFFGKISEMNKDKQIFASIKCTPFWQLSFWLLYSPLLQLLVLLHHNRREFRISIPRKLCALILSKQGRGLVEMSQYVNCVKTRWMIGKHYKIQIIQTFSQEILNGDSIFMYTLNPKQQFYFLQRIIFWKINASWALAAKKFQLWIVKVA